MALSPDGQFGLASRNFTSDAPELVLIPTGTGQARALPRGGVNTQAASFFPDGRHVLLAGSPAGQPARTWVQDRAGGDPRPLTADGTRFELSARPVSPDGRTAVAQDAEGRRRLRDRRGRGSRRAGRPRRRRPAAALERRRPLALRLPAGRGPGARGPSRSRLRRREPWLSLAPADLSGVLAVGPPPSRPTAVLRLRLSAGACSDLYVVERPALTSRWGRRLPAAGHCVDRAEPDLSAVGLLMFRGLAPFRWSAEHRI